jgi:amino acid adenylation domain-containing protein
MHATNSKLFDEKLSADRDYWLEKLSGALAPAGLPLDFKRPVDCSGEKIRFHGEIEPEVVDRLLSVCGNADTLVFAALVAALNVCLYKYTGNGEIIVGTTIHERHREVAALNKLLALRNHVEGGMTGGQLLQEVKRTLAEAYSHQKYAFDSILELLQRETSGNRAPLFDVVALLDTINNPEHVRTLRNDVTIVFSMGHGRISAAISYSPRLFKRRSLEVFWDHYRRALRALIDRPDARVADLDLLSSDRRREILFDFNETKQDYPGEATIHHLFEEQVTRTPDDVALVFKDRLLSFAELNGRANQLARRLRKLGVAPGILVGLYLEHGPEMVVAILGALKAGGAYVPIEPTHPRQRADFMLKDAGITIVLTQQALIERLPGSGLVILALDTGWDELAEESAMNPPPAAAAEDPAYVIYTSGSTGEPKGVKIQHRALVNYICWAKHVYMQDLPQGGKIAFALYSSLGFDLTVTSIYTPLVTGNQLRVYRAVGKESPLMEALRDDQVDVIKLTPSHLALMKENDHRGGRIKRLIVGGEALQTELARQVYERFGGRVEIFNEYGPTEATVGCMVHKFDPAQDDRISVPIGRPAANVQIYILDEHLNPVPENGVGELYISGEGLAEGYLNRAELTGARFIDHPFICGKRMYKTGDLARWLDGVVEYIGRRDEQIKYHGYRVELNEIRSVLNSHSQIRDSVVTVRKDKNGQDVLVAYYASRNEIDQKDLRSFLAERIIEETIPNLFVHITRLPLTLNGKINYQALPTLADIRENAKRTYVAPRNATERTLSEIWAKLLDVRQVGAEDNFFELGGHSLLAAQVITQIRDVLRIDVALQTLFESPTVSELAERIAMMSGAPAPAIGAAIREGEAPLSFAQQRFWFLNSLNPGDPAYNLRAPVRLTGPLNVSALEQAVGEIVRRHEVLRTVFPAVQGRPVQVIMPSQSPPIPLADLSGIDRAKAGAMVDRLLALDALRRFDLSGGPLVRVSIERLGELEHVLQFTMHHIISDGWSVEVLNHEVSSLYQSFSGGIPAALPEPPIQYADFSAWQREQLRSDALEGQLAYWKRQLSGAGPVLDSLADRARQKLRSCQGSTCRFTLGTRLADGLRALSRRRRVTLFTTLLAAFQALLHRYTGQDDIVVGSSVANRGRAETKGLIGCLINTVALRTDMSGNPTFTELLTRVQEVNTVAQANQDAPFELVIETLHPERRTNYTPLIQVWFALRQPMTPIEQPSGLLMTPVEVDLETAQFDLTLTMSETAEEIVGMMNYSAELFDDDSIAEMIDQYCALLEAVVADPDGRILDLPLINQFAQPQAGVNGTDAAPGNTSFPSDAVQPQTGARAH